jgi:HPr kinase/phosphorylase
MHLHASCAARDGAGVLLIGPPGSGKSDLLLRLLDHGFSLVADDQVVLEGGVARAPDVLAGLIEVRGLGILRSAYVASTPVALAVAMGAGERLPEPELHLGVPLVHIDPAQASAPARVAAALRCALGQADLLAGAIA